MREELILLNPEWSIKTPKNLLFESVLLEICVFVTFSDRKIPECVLLNEVILARNVFADPLAIYTPYWKLFHAVTFVIVLLELLSRYTPPREFAEMEIFAKRL